MLQQKTIKTPVSTIGIGVHTGDKVQLTLNPAPQQTGIVFIRSDLPNRPQIHANATNVSNTMLATSLSENGVTVSCVEHLMSAIWSAGIDNLYIEVSSEEIPIMDGSAAPFIYLIKQSGTKLQNAPKQFIKIKKAIEISTGDSRASLRPFEGFKASYTFVYDHHVYNRYPKFAELDFTQVTFEDEISRARTFGLAKDLDHAQSMNKCLGSSLENAVGIDDYNILNKNGLRYEDEFVKHKLLDAIGDLYLLGHSIIGAFEGYKSGHASNNALARALLEQTDAWELVSYENHPIADQLSPVLQPLAA